LFQEELRYYLMTERGLSQNRVNELIPIYPSNAPTIIQSQDLNVRNPPLFFIKNDMFDNKDKERNPKVSQSNQQTQHLPLEDIYREFINKRTSQRDLKKRTNSFDTISTKKRDVIQKIKSYLHVWPSASNNWVVSGIRTTTGKPFLCNDPHLSLLVLL
jgi:acyl-homoserine lactone acylase PvdQ